MVKLGVSQILDGYTLSERRQRFLSNERSVQCKGTWDSFQKVVKEYLDLGHAEVVPSQELNSTIEQG